MEQKKAELIREEEEERLEKLTLESELAQNQAKLNVCILAEQEEMGVSVQDLNCVPSADKDKDMKKIPRITSDHKCCCCISCSSKSSSYPSPKQGIPSNMWSSKCET